MGGALPRPELPSGPGRDLNDALHDLHHHAGWPSLRVMARETGVSHTTVSHLFSTRRLPTWGVLELLVEALNGGTAHFHDLWLAASTSAEDVARPARIAGRRAELTAVRRHLESGAGLLLVTGEAGIGKTKLVTTAADQVKCFVATGHCLPLSSQVPLMPIAEALRSIFDSDGGVWFEEALGACPTYVAPTLGVLLPELGSCARWARAECPPNPRPAYPLLPKWWVAEVSSRARVVAIPGVRGSRRPRS